MKAIKYIWIILSILLLTYCSDDNEQNNIGNPSTVVFLTEIEENRTVSMDVLAFRVDANDPSKELFAYRTKGRDLQDNGSTQNKKFLATLLQSNDKFRFVVIANATEQIDNLGDITIGAAKEELLARLQLVNNGKWETNVSSPSYKDIPMWGESEQIQITNFTSVISLKLLRMIARFDVFISPGISDKFKLKSVRLYNYSTHGRIVPNTDPENWNGIKVLEPTIPADNIKIEGPLIYDTPTIENVAFYNEIFTLESQVVGVNELTKRTCLVIGGIYDTDSKETFYRLEIANQDINKNILYNNILRNYLYNIRIMSVGGSGHPTPEIAFNSQAVNIETEITAWENAGLSDVVFNGQYMLRVSKGEVNLPMDKITETSIHGIMAASTNFPGGWTIDKITDTLNADITWLSTNIRSGTANSKVTFQILADQNDSGSTRYGLIHLKAGVLTYIINVIQSSDPDIGLSILNIEGDNITELVFNSHVGGSVPSQTMKVSWLPTSSDNIVTVTKIGNHAFDFGTGDVISSGSINDPSGNKNFVIQPPAMTASEIASDVFLEKISKIDFMVNNGSDYELKSIILKQINYDVDLNIDINFVMDGTEQYFTVRANAPWTIEKVNDPNNVITNLITTHGGQFRDKRVEKINFTIVDDMTTRSIRKSQVTFKIKSTNPLYPFTEKTFTANFYSGKILPESNSYIISPSSEPVMIPVKRINQTIVENSISAADPISANLVWTDNANRIASNSNIADIVGVGRGETGYVRFTPGTATGNTVVAAKINNVIKWSWHMWVTTYNPETTNKPISSYTIMDRNLGAFANSNSAAAIGLLYQWGRKDPFPGGNGLTSNIGTSIYDSNGSIQPQLVSTAGTGTLINSINNPIAFYCGSTGWVGSDGNNSWGVLSATKTIYDPCPPGWKTVPTGAWSHLNTSNFVWSNYGRNNTTSGWFQAAGIRESGTGNIGQTGGTGSYWSTTSGIHLGFYSNSVTPNQSFSVANGFNVRCVRE